MNEDLMKAILAMDSYNRGYDAGLGNSINGLGGAGSRIGNAVVSNIALPQGAQAAGFYAIAYNYGAGSIISFRGTDDKTLSLNPINVFNRDDLWNGYGIGAGSAGTKQAELAFKFYQSVAGVGADLTKANISLTGHSLGGGLAGLIGAVYQREALVFDNMPFELAATKTKYESTPHMIQTILPGGEILETGPYHNEALKALVYGNKAPWNTSLANVRAMAMEGESLGMLRGGQTTIPTVISPGDSVDLSGAERHSMASLVITMFGRGADVSDKSWVNSAKYFWNALYDNNFASDVGIKTSSNVSGKLQSDKEYAAILQTIIAYSALDSGERPYGDTAIRALFDDANDMGRSLGGDYASRYAQDVAKIFVQYAAILALKDKEGLTSDLVKGALKRSSDDKSLIVDLTDAVWKAANTTVPSIVAKKNLIDNIFSTAGNTGAGTTTSNPVKSGMLSLWGDGTEKNIDRVFLSNSKGLSAAIENSAVPKVTLYMASTGSDTIVGSNGNDLIFGNYGSDTLSGGAGNDLLDGGLGTDTASYKNDPNAIIATITGKTGNSNVGALNADVEDGSGNVDKLYSIEKIVGSNYNDRFITNGHAVILEGGAGGDTYIIGTGVGAGRVRIIENAKDPGDDALGTPANVTPDKYVKTNTPNGIRLEPKDGGAGPIIDVPNGIESTQPEGGQKIPLSQFPDKEDPEEPERPDEGGMDYVPASPLVLDLDGDGVEVTKLGFGQGASQVYFDMNNDNFAERTAWVTGGDGLLAWDKNGNGIIDNQSELFGDNAQFMDGFRNLASLDSNKDNLITNKDANFSSLRVWVDADGDGYTDSGELKTLSSLKITSINLAAQTQYNLYKNENAVSATSTFTMNGATRAIEDIWFRTDKLYTRYLGDSTVSAETFDLPLLRGTGNLKNLDVAMTQDPALMALVTAFKTSWSLSKLANRSALDAEIQSILFKWAGVENIVTSSRGSSIDARIVEFLETYIGKEYGTNQGWAVVTVGPGAAASLKEIYNQVFERFKANIIFQVSGNSIVKDVPQYSLMTGMVDKGVVTATTAKNISTAAAASTDKAAFWNHYIDILLKVKEFEEFSATEVAALDAEIKSSLGSAYSFKILTDAYYQGFSSYTGRGSNFSDVLVGTHGSDTLYGLNGDDVISGGKGNDSLYGDYGNDTYKYSYGDGVDTITDSEGVDTLKIEGNYTAANITLERPNLQDFNVFLNGQMIATIKNQSYAGLEKISFSNNTFIDLALFKDIVGTSAADILNGADNAIMRGDVIYGNAGNDTLNGKIGNDYLFGSSGNDKYVYSNGSDQGTDRIRDDDGTADSITLGSSYTSSNIVLERTGQYDLAIKSGGKTLIIIENQFTQYGSIETLTYGNGASLNLLTYSHTVNGTANADTIYGTSYGAGADKLNGLGGNDYIYAGAGNDTVTGGDGDDYIYGDDGNDTLSGNAGNDYVNGGLGNDTIIYESGLDRFSDNGGTDVINITNTAITSANMTLRRNVGNQSDLDILLNGTHAFTIQGQFYQNGGFETIKFANGTTFDLTKVQYTSAGTSGNDNLYGISYGGNPNDILNGGAGNDSLYGYDGNDTLDGGTGTDRLYGGKGNDIYKISLNAGVDTISDEGGADTIQFGAGFSKANMTVQRDAVNANNLNILFGGVIAVTIADHFRQGYLVETLKFSDNTIYNLAGVSYTQNGTAASDYLQGHDGIDILKGNGGNDNLYAYAGNDTLDGGAGDDYLYGGLGNDTYVLNTGFGKDCIFDEGGTDVVQLGAGITASNLRFEVSGHDLVIYVGTNGDQVTLSGQFYDLMYGTSYYDEIETLKLSDGTSINLLSGLTFTGTSSNDYVYGTGSADALLGLAGNDYLYGYAGNDTLDGGAGGDYLYGGLGNDTYVLNTGFGSDYISDEGGTDVIQLGTGITASNLRFEVSGHDLIIYVGTNGDQVTLSGQLYDLMYGTSYYDEIETLKFSNGTSINLLGGLTFTGTSSNDYVYGTGSADTLQGFSGNDSLYGYSGNDKLEGGVGDDYLYGGLGNDTYVLNTGFGKDYISDEGGTDVIQLGTGITASNLRFEVSGHDLIIYVGTNGDQVTLSGQFYDLMYGTSYYDEIETLKLSNGTSINLLSGLTFTGTSSNDYVYGTGAADTLQGLAGSDYLSAYSGNDTLDGGAGDDYLYGGLGDDAYVYASGQGLDYVSDDGGIDTIRLASGITTENISIADYSSYDTKIIVTAGVNEIQISNQHYTDNIYAIEKLEFADGFAADLLTYKSWIWGSTAAQTTNGTANADTILGRGGNDTINGAAGNDALHGGSGNDTVKGGDGNDLVHGGIGNDSLYGDAGNDALYGDDGLDNLWGGAGADIFMFRQDTAFKNIDVINDFSKTQLDKINIANLLQGYNPVTKAITDFVEITTVGSDSILKVDADGGANGFVQIATIKGVTGLTDEAALVASGNLVVV